MKWPRLGAEAPSGAAVADPDGLADLLASIDAAGVAEPQGWPEPTPVSGQSDREWRAETARLRAQHDAKVLEIRRLTEPPTAVAQVGACFYARFPGAGEDPLIGRLYLPRASGPVACLLFLHGGGWWMAGGATGFEINDLLCRKLCSGLDAAIVNLDYRLAPEHRFPEPLEDVYRVLCWLHDEGPRTLVIDPDRIGVMGISSGGNLAAALALLTRDRGGPAIKAQLLQMPALDLTSSTSAGDDNDARAAASRVRTYYAGTDTDLSHPYLSPALAPDLSQSPPTVIVLADLDPLRDEGRCYAERLATAGVDIEVLQYRMTHTVATPAVAGCWLQDLVAAAGRRL